MTVRHFRTSYFDKATTGLADVLKQASQDLRESSLEFDTLVGTGFSGAVVIPALAMSLDKHYVLVRKENDDSHHGGGRLVGTLGQRWLFVDDFISSGSTRSRVISRIDEEMEHSEYKTEHAGSYLYITAMNNYNGRLLDSAGETIA